MRDILIAHLYDIMPDNHKQQSMLPQLNISIDNKYEYKMATMVRKKEHKFKRRPTDNDQDLWTSS